MPLTALFLLPVPPTTPSPSPSLISHISLTFDCTTLPNDDTPTPFHLTHHLFASTSSLLPNKSATRSYTQLLTLSHHPDTTFVGTASPPSEQQPTTTQITIPASSAETFIALLHTKLQPHWSARQSVAVNDGTALLLKTPVGEVELRIGDLRTMGGRTGPPNALRGVLVEVTRLEVGGEVGGKVKDKEKALSRAVLERLLGGTGVKMDGEGAREVFGYTSARTGMQHKETDDGQQRKPQTDWALSELYMEMLRPPKT